MKEENVIIEGVCTNPARNFIKPIDECDDIRTVLEFLFGLGVFKKLSFSDTGPEIEINETELPGDFLRLKVIQLVDERSLLARVEGNRL